MQLLRRRDVASIVTAVAAAAASRPGRAQGLLELTMSASSTSFVVGGVRIGEAAGLFERNGIRLRISVMDSGSAAMAALLSRSVPFAIAGPPEALAARARQQDVLVIANLYAGLAGSLVLAKPVVEKVRLDRTAPVRERLRVLDGLVIAVPSATSALLGPVRSAAEEAGAKIRFTYMAQGAMPAALENGAIQGFVGSSPFSGTAVLRGTGVIWIDGPGGELPPDVRPASSSCVLTTGAYLKGNAEAVRRVQRTVVDIAHYIEREPDGARQALAAAYPQLGAPEVALAFEQQWRNWTKPFLTAADMRQELKLLAASAKLPGLDLIDPAATLAATP